MVIFICILDRDTPVSDHPCQIDLSRLSGREIWCRSDDIIWWQYIRRSVSTAAAGRKIARLLHHWFFADFQVAIWRIFQSGISALVCRYCRYSLGSRVGGGEIKSHPCPPSCQQTGKRTFPFHSHEFLKSFVGLEEDPFGSSSQISQEGLTRGVEARPPCQRADSPSPAR